MVMSQRENNCKGLNRQPLDEFEAALAALRPRVDVATTPEAISSCRDDGALLTTCGAPGGHEFVCIHCGSNPPLISPIRRWGWPAAAAVMASLAACLLVMLITNQSTQVAREQPLLATHAVKPAQQIGRAPAKQMVTTVDAASIPRVARRIGERRTVLSAADLDLPGESVASNPNSRRPIAVSYADIETVEAKLTNAALKRRFLSQ